MKKRIGAEKIETVTIFYSDLDNFTEIYNDSTPFEVCGDDIITDDDDNDDNNDTVLDGGDAELLLQDV